jgi:hypothetical protein
MTDNTEAAAQESAPMARRLLMVGGAAAAGTAVAAIARSDPAAAGHNTNIAYDSQTVLHADVTNTTAGSTRISSNDSGTAAFVALNDYTVGISRPDAILGRTNYTTSNCAGVAGTCENATGGIGVMGTSKSLTGTGVYAFAGSVVPSTVAPAGTGLYASGPLNGVVAIARVDNGVALTATAPPAGGRAAVLNGATEVKGALTVDNATKVGGALTVDGGAMVGGALTVEGPVDAGTVQANGLRLPRTSGQLTLARAKRKVTIKQVPLAEGSVVVATLQKAKKGVHVAAAEPVAAGGKITITFSKKAPSGTVVGWVVVN